MKSAGNILKRRYLSRGLTCFLAWCVVIHTSLPVALALEAVDVTGSTGVLSTTWGDHTIIDTDHGAIINWSDFNTNSNQSITFNQYLGGDLSSMSAVLNRVNSGAVPTQFDGALNANGRVFVVNPAGVIFGAGSAVDVSQLVASGLNMSDDAFGAVLADSSNRMTFEGGWGEVRNLGSISAESVFLIGKNVINLGSISAPDGLVVMASGDNVYLGQDGSNVVVELDAESANTAADVQNRGLVSAGNGTIVLAAGDNFSGAVGNVGVLAASVGEVTVDVPRAESAAPNGSGADSDGLDAAKIIINGCEVAPTPAEPQEPTEPKEAKEPAELSASKEVKDQPETINPFIEPAPLGNVKLETSGCSALMKWAAAELGVDEKKMEIWVANSVASARGIQPCDTCAKLKGAATILRDSRGLRVAALSQVIGEFASSAVPPSEEQDASIIAAITSNSDAGSHYAMAGEYLDSLAMYVGALSSEMNFSTIDSVMLAADRYIAPLAETESDNVGLAAFLAARLAALSES